MHQSVGRKEGLHEDLVHRDMVVVGIGEPRRRPSSAVESAA